MTKTMFWNSNAVVDDDNVFFYPIEEGDISPNDLEKFVNYHRSKLLPNYIKSRNYYKGKHKILKESAKESWKPDNRLLYNFPKKLVNTFGGFFLGTPARIDIDNANGKESDSSLDDWLKSVNFDDVNFEVSKQIDIYGRSHYFVYQNEDSETKLVAVDPRNAFVIYSNDVEKRPLFAVVYSIDNKNNGVNGTLYTDSGNYAFKMLPSMGCQIDSEPIDDVKPFDDNIQLIEVYSNEERQGLFEDALNIIDGINHEMSEKANDFDAQADSILKIIGAKMKDDKRVQVRSNKTLEIPNVAPGTTVDVDYINKASNDAMQEHLIDRNVDYLYQTTGIANLNDESFGTASGVALEYKLQPMSNLADMKARKMTPAIKRVIKTAFSAIRTMDAKSKVLDHLDEINIKFIKTTPRNVSDEAETLNKLLDSGKVSPETALKVVSIIDDPEKELKRVAASQQDDIERAQEIADKFAIDADKSGVINEANSSSKE